MLVQWCFYKNLGLFPSLSDKTFSDEAHISVFYICPKTSNILLELLNVPTKFGLEVELTKNDQLMRQYFLIFLQCHAWRGVKEDKAAV